MIPVLRVRETGSTVSDQEIAGRIIAAIARDRRLALSSGIDSRMKIKAEGGIVTISGVVDCAGDRMAAEELAESVPGVRKVQSAMTVSVDEYLDDDDLDEKVREALNDAGFENVGSNVSHGVARLVGQVDRLSQEEAAIRAAAGVKGIRDVASSVKVRMPKHADEADLLSLVVPTVRRKRPGGNGPGDQRTGRDRAHLREGPVTARSPSDKAPDQRDRGRPRYSGPTGSRRDPVQRLEGKN